jgi:modulator of FtsH protease HflK
MSWNEPGGDNKDPWSGQGGKGGDQKGPPDLDEAIRSIQEKLSKLFGGKGGNGGSSPGSFNAFNPIKNVSYVIAGIFVLWLLSGFYIVDEGRQGVETQFGKYTRTTEAGLNWHIPSPIENVVKVNVQQQRFKEIGYRSGTQTQGSVSVPKEALMLTKDENYIDVQLAVQYQVKDAKAFLFSLSDPEETLKQTSESVLRGVIGGSEMDFVLTEGRSEVVALAKKEIQETMDGYNSGIQITSVNLQDAQPPEQVQHAFEDAIKAREDQQRFINEAEAYANDVVPKARGMAARKIQEAQGYKEQVIAQAEGETSRFSQLLTEYKKAPEITRKRLYIETLENVLSETNTVIVDVKNGNNLLYLPIDKMHERKTQTTTPEDQISVDSPSQPSVPTERKSSKPRTGNTDDERQQILERITTRARERETRGR